jgi:hypothetical protein
LGNIDSPNEPFSGRKALSEAEDGWDWEEEG